MKNKIYKIIISFLITLIIITFFLYSDMTYQRDVALTTADWCYVNNNSNRCIQWVEQIEIPRFYMYLFIK